MNDAKIISQDDIIKLISQLESIEKQLKALSRNALLKRWLRTNELAEYLSLSPSQIHNLRVEGVITRKKLLGTNYYDKNEIDNHFNEQEL